MPAVRTSMPSVPHTPSQWKDWIITNGFNSEGKTDDDTLVDWKPCVTKMLLDTGTVSKISSSADWDALFKVLRKHKIIGVTSTNGRPTIEFTGNVLSKIDEARSDTDFLFDIEFWASGKSTATPVTDEQKNTMAMQVTNVLLSTITKMPNPEKAFFSRDIGKRPHVRSTIQKRIIKPAQEVIDGDVDAPHWKNTLPPTVYPDKTFISGFGATLPKTLFLYIKSRIVDIATTKKIPFDNSQFDLYQRLIREFHKVPKEYITASEAEHYKKQEKETIAKQTAGGFRWWSTMLNLGEGFVSRRLVVNYKELIDQNAAAELANEIYSILQQANNRAGEFSYTAPDELASSPEGGLDEYPELQKWVRKIPYNKAAEGAELIRQAAARIYETLQKKAREQSTRLQPDEVKATPVGTGGGPGADIADGKNPDPVPPDQKEEKEAFNTRPVDIPDATLRSELVADAGGERVEPTEAEMLMSDINYDLFPIVAPGHGLGARNKLFRDNERRTKRIRFSDKMMEPRSTQQSVPIRPPPAQWADAMPKNMIEKFFRDAAKDILKSELLNRKVKGSTGAIPGDTNKIPSSIGLKRSRTNILKPKTDTLDYWLPKYDVGAGLASTKRGLRSRHDTWDIDSVPRSAGKSSLSKLYNGL